MAQYFEGLPEIAIQPVLLLAKKIT